MSKKIIVNKTYKTSELDSLENDVESGVNELFDEFSNEIPGHSVEEAS